MRKTRSTANMKWIPLSPEQEMFWLYFRFTGDSLNIVFKIELPADTDPAKVTESFNAVISAHDIFWYQAARYRTKQILWPVCPIQVDPGIFNLKDRAELNELMEAMKVPFSLFEGPKIRARLMRNPDASYTFYISAPHFVIDYVTMILLNQAFIRHLRGLPSLTKKIATYADYIASFNSKEGLQKRLDDHQYWKHALKHATPFHLPRSYVPKSPDDLQTIHFRFSPERYAQLTGIARQMCIPDPIFLYGCIYTALYALTGNAHFSFPFMFAVKRTGELAETMGPMIGLLPVNHTFSIEHDLHETIMQIYKLVRTAHKQKRFAPNIDLMSSTPDLLTHIPWKYRLFTGTYALMYRLFRSNMISAENMRGSIAKTKALGLPVFARQASEPYTLMFNPRLSRDMKGETYSLWIGDTTQTLAMSGDNEATDHRPGGIYFTFNYDKQDHIELHSTPFINTAGQEKLTSIIEAIFAHLATPGEMQLKKLMA